MRRGHSCADQRQASAHVTVTANRKTSAATICTAHSTYYCLRGCDTLFTQTFTDVSGEATACIFGVYGCRFISDHTASHTTNKFFFICKLWRQYGKKFIIRMRLNGLQRRWKGSIGIGNYKGQAGISALKIYLQEQNTSNAGKRDNNIGWHSLVWYFSTRC